MAEGGDATPSMDARHQTSSGRSLSDPGPGESKDYRMMLLKLGKELRIGTMREIAYVAGLDTAFLSELDQTNSADECFAKLRTRLEAKEKLGKGNTDELRSILKDLKHEKGVKIIEDFEAFQKDPIPSSPESSDDEAEENNETSLESDHFTAFLKLVGLEGRFSNKLTLRDATVVRDFSGDVPVSDLPFLFIKKLASLDYRASFPDTYSGKINNIRDFLYAILKCSDNFLAQYIFERLSMCQLAVPILLPKVGDETKPIFMLWALRRVIKEWKTTESVFLEKRMSNWPTFTVAFVRIGDIPLSKSLLINNMLGRVQGNNYHSYFLSKKEDNLSDAQFSKGTIESLWVLPSNKRESHSLNNVVAILNLRGDVTDYPTQKKLVCEMANVVIAIVAQRDSKKRVLNEIKVLSQDVLFVCLKRENKLVKNNVPTLKDGCLFYKVRDDDEGMALSKDLWQRTIEKSKECLNNCEKLENFAYNFCNEVELDEKINGCDEAKRKVGELLGSETKVDLAEFKNTHLPLQKIYLDWVKFDKQRLASKDFVEKQLADIKKKKKEKRDQQREKGLSTKLELFWKNLEVILVDSKRFNYFLINFQDVINKLAIECTTPHLDNMTRLEKELHLLEGQTTTGKSKKKKKKKKRNSEKTMKNETEIQSDEVKRVRRSLNIESHEYSNKYIGFEHFVREMGQLYEAYVNGSYTCPEDQPRVQMLPKTAAYMLLEGYPLEVLDGDSCYVPIVWVSHVLKILSEKLNNPKLFVLSVIGVQSSGKSTLLNAMFGVRLPVRAGRCTRGLFMQMLEVEESFSSKLGFRYVIIIDTEGLRSPDRALLDDNNFDNALATLALCLGDLTLLNIQGEVISQDMTGILQIAVHALIRMNEVNLTSHCLIVQQRISDKTTGDWNKANMNKIIEILDKATLLAATEEDVEHKYNKFSDIFPFIPETDLHHIPCLWMGDMSPPNHFYSEGVTNLRQMMWSTSESKRKRIQPQFTMDEFISRLQDVWKAIKEEDFVFNFQNSLRALSYNKFRLKFHTWIGQFRQKILTWEVERCSACWTESIIASIKSELKDKLKRDSDEVKGEIDKYIKDHENEEELKKHVDSFKHEVDDISTDIDRGVSEKLDKEHRNVQHVLESWKIKLREMAQVKAEKFRKQKSGKKSSSSTGNMENIFEECWKEWINEIKTKDMTMTTSKDDIMRACETSLIELSERTAISKTLEDLIRGEGGIKKQSPNFKVEDYLERQMSGTEARKIELFVEDVIRRNLGTLRTRSSDKLFDANLVKVWLGNALNELLSTEKQRMKIPKSVVSKSLLHICGKVAEILITNQRVLSKQVEKEKETLYQDFCAFVDDSNQCQTVALRVFDCLVHIFKQLTLNVLNLKIVGDMRTINHFVDKERLIAAILYELGKRGDHGEYIKFVRDQEGYIKEWLERKVIEQCSGTFIYDTAQENIRNLSMCVRRICEKLSDGTELAPPGTFCGWLKRFRDESTKINKCFPVALVGLEYFNNVKLDCADFTNKLIDLIKRATEEDTFINAIQIPTSETDEEHTKIFLSSMKNPPHIEILNQFKACGAKCPFCKVLCHLQGKGHKNHCAVLHYPQGLAGCKFTESSKLVIDMCTTSVASDNQYRFGEKGQHRHFREYKTDFPDWSITPIKDSEPTIYWKWVMTRFNEKFAMHYKIDPAVIPDEWKTIGKERALASLNETYMIK